MTTLNLQRMTTLNLQIDRSENIALESPLGMSLPCEFLVELSEAGAKAGLRFEPFLPEGAIVDSATLIVYIDSKGGDNPATRIFGELGDHVEPFAAEAADLSRRTWTSASVSWNDTYVGTGFRASPDLSSVIQQIIERSPKPDALSLFLEHESKVKSLRFRGYGYDSATAPRLDIDFHIPFVAASYAPAWLADALKEVRSRVSETGNRDARRREIVFAVAFAESYLFEWVRDDVLHRNMDELRTYFAHKSRPTVHEKWKKIPRLLLADGRIRDAPDPSKQQREEWNRLVTFRDGLLHAVASFPTPAPGGRKSRAPEPAKEDLEKMEPGWALRVVLERVVELHHKSHTSVPEWLKAQIRPLGP